MKYKLGDEVYLKGVITSVNSCAEINYPYEVKTADEFVAAAEQHLEPINKSELRHAEEAPRFLRNVLARLRELPKHDRNIWLKGIMGEFDEEFSHVKWRDGYEQGKFDRAVEAEKSNKVVIPQFAADWIDYCKFTHVDLQHALVVGDVYFYSYANQKDFSKLKEFLETENNQELFARAWLCGYEVEKEKRYTARLKVVTIKKAGYLNRHNKNGSITIDTSYTAGGQYQVYFTRSELEDLDVWDNPAFEIKEVE